MNLCGKQNRPYNFQSLAEVTLMEHGYRHEYKYLISKADAELLKRRLPYIMEPEKRSSSLGR